HGAFGIAPQPELAPLERERIEECEPSDERIAAAEEQLDCIERLKRADDAGQNAEHATLGATRNEARGGRLAEEAAVAGRTAAGEHGDLSFEAQDRPVDVGLDEEHACVVDEVPRSEVVGAVDHDI